MEVPEATQSFAALKRRLTPGTTIQLLRHDWLDLGLLRYDAMISPRKVIKCNSQELVLETGGVPSYLTWPQANRIRFDGLLFAIDLNTDPQEGSGFRDVMIYEILGKDA